MGGSNVSSSGSGSPKSPASTLSNGSKEHSAEYLAQLLKDKKQLAAFPNVFQHLERLVDGEIGRVRMSLFQFEFSKDPMDLPDPTGSIQTIQEKIYVPVADFPDFNFVGRILGPRGMTAKQLELETGCKIMVRGKGSMRDKKKEDQNRGKPNWEHLSDELHVLIQCEDAENRARIKLKRAKEEINKLLVPAPEGEDELKRKQLMELAIINGTYRSGTQTKSSMPTPRLLTPMTAASSALRTPPTLGAPIILSPTRAATSAASYIAPNYSLAHPPAALLPASATDLHAANGLYLNSYDTSPLAALAAYPYAITSPYLASEYPAFDWNQTAANPVAHHLLARH